MGDYIIYCSCFFRESLYVYVWGGGGLRFSTPYKIVFGEKAYIGVCRSCAPKSYQCSL